MNDKKLPSQAVDPRDTSQPGREEEVIEQKPDFAKKGFEEGLFNNDNTEEQPRRETPPLPRNLK